MTIHTCLHQLLSHIRAVETANHRSPGSVTLLAVSKTQSPEKIREAYEAGQRCFGENYLQEAISKQQQLADLAIEWHFIGHIQSNKTKQIAMHFDWVHSVDRLFIAEKLNAHRPANRPPLNICIEVNMDNEKTKSGIMPSALMAFVKEISVLKNLRLRGLMIIPERNSKTAFVQAAQLQQQLIQAGVMVDTLSMGMSSDFELAIEAGATIVRIGTALFGER